jgi:hypothetical protein
VCTAAPDGRRHWSSCSGEPPAEDEKWAARLARRLPREGVSAKWLARCGPDGGTPHSPGRWLAACADNPLRPAL